MTRGQASLTSTSPGYGKREAASHQPKPDWVEGVQEEPRLACPKGTMWERELQDSAVSEEVDHVRASASRWC